MTTRKPPKKAAPTPAPREFVITHNLPPGAMVVPPPKAIKELVRLFGEKALVRAGVELGREAD